MEPKNRWISATRVWEHAGGIGILIGYKSGLMLTLIIGPWMIFLGPHITRTQTLK